MNIQIVGYIAAFLTTFAFLPQVIRTVKTKSTEDLSLVMFSMMELGMILWLVYGWNVGDKPLIYANSIASIFGMIILYYKLKEVFSKK
jgi:MtN3 and saliva related transmembrane protein